MRFVPNGPDIPERVISDHRDGKILFICGAGVSITAGLPLFQGLVKKVYAALKLDWRDSPAENLAMRAKQFDRALRCLERRLAPSNFPKDHAMREKIRNAVRRVLTPKDSAPLANHQALIALSGDRNGSRRLVTTNFDTLFERAWLVAEGATGETHAGAALPQPNSSRFEGILHLHGRLSDNWRGLVIPETDLVLTSAEFGDAYLKSGWASRYVCDLVRAYTLVLVGYQAEDPPMRYLLEALETDRDRFPDLNPVYAIALAKVGDEENQEALWDAKGIRPILYGGTAKNHSALYGTLQEWSRYAEDPIAWRKTRLTLLFATPLAESTEKAIAEVVLLLQQESYYQLLFELNPPSAWLTLLHDRNPFSEDRPLPASWIATRANDPEMIRACSGIQKFDFGTCWSITRALDASPEPLSPVRQKAWRLLCRVKMMPISEDEDRDWHVLMPSINRGIVDFHAREQARQALQPRLTINTPFASQLHPPANGEERLGSLCRIDFRTPQYPAPRNILDVWPLSQDVALFFTLNRALEEALEEAEDAEFMQGWDLTSMSVPSVSEHKQNENRGGSFYPLVQMLAELVSRIAASDPAAGRRASDVWRNSSFLLSKRLRLFSLLGSSFTPSGVADELIAIERSQFWDRGLRVELVKLLATRWEEFSESQKAQIELRIAEGPPAPPENGSTQKTTEEWKNVLDRERFNLLAAIVDKGGNLTSTGASLLTEIKSGNPEWKRSEGDRDDFLAWSQVSWGSKSHPERLADVPEDRLPSEALRIQQEQPFDERDLWDQFCQTNPEKALRSLKLASENGEWNPELWAPLLSPLIPADLPSILEVAKCLLAMPDETVTVLLPPAASWLRDHEDALIGDQKLEDSLYFSVWDRLGNFALSDAQEATEAAIETIDFTRALNTTGGALAWSLLSAFGRQSPTTDSRITAPWEARFSKIARDQSDAGVNGRIMFAHALAFLDRVDPAWVLTNMIPRMSWGQPEAHNLLAATAQNGAPPGRLFNVLKQLMFDAIRDGNISRSIIEALGQIFLAISLSKKLEGNTDDRLSDAEFKRCLELGPEGFREWVAQRLNVYIKVDGEQPDARSERWTKAAGPTFRAIWPLDARFRSVKISKSLVGAAVESGAAFGEAVEDILPLLVPFRMPMIQLTLSARLSTVSLLETQTKPFVHLLNGLVDPTVFPKPHDLGTILASCLKADSTVERDPAYKRLLAIHRRSGR